MAAVRAMLHPAVGPSGRCLVLPPPARPLLPAATFLAALRNSNWMQSETNIGVGTGAGMSALLEELAARLGSGKLRRVKVGGSLHCGVQASGGHVPLGQEPAAAPVESMPPCGMPHQAGPWEARHLSCCPLCSPVAAGGACQRRGRQRGGFPRRAAHHPAGAGFKKQHEATVQGWPTAPPVAWSHP